MTEIPFSYNRDQFYLQVLHGLQLARGRRDERVDRELRSASEELLASCVADRARPVADDVISVPSVRVHAVRALFQGLTEERQTAALYISFPSFSFDILYHFIRAPVGRAALALSLAVEQDDAKLSQLLLRQAVTASL